MNPRLLKGIDEFNRGLYFECHETLEEIWIEEHGADRDFYQGIIQVSAGYFKWQQGVPRGAIKLWRTGLAKLEAYPAEHLGLALESFIRGVATNLRRIEAAYQTGSGDMSIEVPVLMPMPRAGPG